MGGDLPPELEGWNWGAFFLNWVWGLAHNTWVALLMFVPLVNIVLPFVLGARGNAWAWRNNQWRDIDHFRRVQRIWARVGWGAAIAIPAFVGLVFVGVEIMLTSSVPYHIAIDELREHPRLERPLGLPVEPSGWMVSGNLNMQNDTGHADLSFDVAGPKGAGIAYVNARRTDAQWTVYHLSVETDNGERIVLVGKD